MLQSVGAKVFVRSMEVVHFSECPLLSEVPLYPVRLGVVSRRVR